MKKRLSASEARQKIYRYCAYQERSHAEVRDKLYSYGLFRDDVDEILSHLITEGYLNEERFAKAFAGGKFRMKKWGRIKIAHELEAKGLTPRCIKMGLQEIEEEAYQKALEELLLKKSALNSEEDLFVKRDQLARYAIQKGFEPDLVWTILKSDKKFKV